MKDIRCVFGCHIYNQAETKIVDERKGYLIARVKMCCLRCGKSYEDIVAIPFPEWLQRKEEKEQPRWIPCSERLPEDGKWCLFTDGENMSVERYKRDAIDHFFPNSRWFDFDEAVAWMPLPEPWKGEENATH